VTIPRTAIQERDGRDVVWVVRDGRLERRAITVRATDNGQATVVAGLTGGEHVLLDPPAAAQEGIRVKEIAQAK
jgi:hypothetical protein